MYRKLVPLIATTAAVVAPVSAAHAAVAVALQKPGTCSVDQGTKQGTVPVPFTVTGLAPNQTTNVTLSGQGFTGAAVPVVGPADGSGTATGNATWTSALGDTPLGDIPATLTVTDAASGAVLAQGPAVVSNASLQIGTAADAKKKKLPKSLEWQVSGLSTLTGSSTYYAFFFRAKDAKKKSPKPYDSMKLGTGTGACGYLKAKRPPAPFSTKGSYLIIVESSKKFDAKGLGLVGALKQ